MNQKGFAPIIVVSILALIFVIGGVGYWVYFVYQPKLNVNLIATSYKGELSSTTTPQTDQNRLAGWKTYTDNRYGYEFQYPPIYTIAPNQYPNNFFINTPNKGFLKLRTLFATTDNILDDEPLDFPQDGKILGKKSIAGKDWLEYTTSRAHFLNYRLYDNGVTYIFTKENSNINDALLDIISTIRPVQSPYPRFDEKIRTLKVGDVFGEFKVAYIKPRTDSIPFSADNVVIRFSGQTRIAGDYAIEGGLEGEQLCFRNLDQVNQKKIPHVDDSYDYNRLVFCFIYDDSMGKYLPNVKPDMYGEVRGTTSVIIKNLVMSSYNLGTDFSADLGGFGN